MSRRSTLSTKPVASLAWSKGYQAGKAGKSKLSNPYRHGTPRREAWNQGWKYGKG